jgi:hypothetical protein
MRHQAFMTNSLPSRFCAVEPWCLDAKGTGAIVRRGEESTP